MTWLASRRVSAKDVPAIRRMMPYLLRGRNESAVYFEQCIDLTDTIPWLRQFNEREGGRHEARIFHLFLAAVPEVLRQYPNLNRFVSGRRICQRPEITLSFVMKPERREGSTSVVKMAFPPDETFTDLLHRVWRRVEDGRSGKRSRSDDEAMLFSRLPMPVLETLVGVFRALDFWGLAPAALVEPDPMFCSMFIANLGSLGMDAAYHHLYEYGNCPIFATIGRIERIPMVLADDRVEPRSVVRIRYSYDERIEDGFYADRALTRLKEMLEDPGAWAS